MVTLYEYGKWSLSNDASGLKSLLRNIWKHRLHKENIEQQATEDEDDRYQPFLNFDENNIRACNYIGFIQNVDELIEIYPKVFRNSTNASKKLMLQHCFFWFSYCRKTHFPFTQTSLDSDHIENFPELIIYLISKKILGITSTQPFMQYHRMEERITTVRGAINFHRYLNQSIVRGCYHLLECDHEPFIYDNAVNRIIKYTSRLLLKQTELVENQQLLNEILFILDEVDDVPCNPQDLDTVCFTPFFEEYNEVMQLCRLVIEQQLYSNNSYDLSQWCLLFPMEYLFEDFVAGFLKKHYSNEWTVEYQKSDKYLTNTPEAFNLQHDIFLTQRAGMKRTIIIDTKYKLRDKNFKADRKKGIDQSDLYQMLSYAMKRGCTELFLVYPNIEEDILASDDFVINAGFSTVPSIKVKAIEIPFWSLNNFHALEHNLKKQFDQILKESNI
jgi:5-methylcytosine-specific restriction enzyme subunit McrC